MSKDEIDESILKTSTEQLLIIKKEASKLGIVNLEKSINEYFEILG